MTNSKDKCIVFSDVYRAQRRLTSKGCKWLLVEAALLKTACIQRTNASVPCNQIQLSMRASKAWRLCHWPLLPITMTPLPRADVRTARAMIIGMTTEPEPPQALCIVRPAQIVTAFVFQASQEISKNKVQALRPQVPQVLPREVY